MKQRDKAVLFGTLGAMAAIAYLRRDKGSNYGMIYPPLPPFTENRIRRDDFGILERNSPLLVPVESSGAQQYVHTLTRDRLFALKEAAAQDGFDNILVASGHRPHRWRSYDQYVQAMIDRYGSLAEGKQWVAYRSPHETGLAIDFGSHGLEPKSATNYQQKQTPFYRWLVNNAHRFGFSPYRREAWHWETKIPKDAWLTGQEFTDDFGVFV